MKECEAPGIIRIICSGCEGCHYEEQLSLEPIEGFPKYRKSIERAVGCLKQSELLEMIDEKTLESGKE